MRLLRSALAGAALIVSATCGGMAGIAGAQPNENELQDIEFSATRGAEIYARDVAAWVATDVLLEHSAPNALGVRGWVTTPIDGIDGLYQVTFVSGEGPDWLIAASFAVQDGKVVSYEIFEDESARFALNAEQVAAFNAQKAASQALTGLPLCSATVNTVVIPTPDGHDAYFLTPQASMDEVQFGRHYRIPVAQDGTVGTVFSFTKSCLAATKGGTKNTVAVVVSDLFGSVPSEIHVFKSLEHRSPIIVVTVSNNRIWEVNGKAIRYMGVADEKD